LAGVEESFDIDAESICDDIGFPALAMKSMISPDSETRICSNDMVALWDAVPSLLKQLYRQAELHFTDMHGGLYESRDGNADSNA
jgi:hypothetical protein